MEKIYVIKIGGNVLDDPQELERFLDAFAALSVPRVLVHGGGKVASALGQRLGLEPVMVEGRRVTDAATLELVTMVYGGLVNKQLVAKLQARGCNALGLTGADAGLMQARRRPPVEKQGRLVDYGWVGDPLPGGTDGAGLLRFLQQGLTPVLAPLTHDGQGSLLNTNADTIAAEAAAALAPLAETHLVYCFEKPGVLLDVDDPASLVPRIDTTRFADLRTQGAVSAGMIPKLENALAAAGRGLASVQIGHPARLAEMASGAPGISTRIHIS